MIIMRKVMLMRVAVVMVTVIMRNAAAAMLMKVVATMTAEQVISMMMRMVVVVATEMVAAAATGHELTPRQVAISKVAFFLSKLAHRKKNQPDCVELDIGVCSSSRSPQGHGRQQRGEE